ncbi:phosphatase PAP2 family protein [Rhodobacter sp. CZR27]|uniref:phosphatase PAP2 family protein n=1 Tax=Rhodobacter sp. CZR27 TaxID=2033869 RepID=UPI000BBF32E0|nr:phosphatase PAP2 family protein [Rhodobacter sp. CZR27]
MAGSKAVSAALGHGLRDNGWLIALALIHTATAGMIAVTRDLPYFNGMFRSLTNLVTILIPVYLMVLLIWTTARLALREPRSRPIRTLLAEIRDILCDLPRMASGLIAMTATVMFFNAFAYLKAVLPELAPFTWDTTLANLDRTLHGGTDPWRLLMPLLGTPLATTAINAAYHFWFFLLYFFLFVSSFTRVNPEARRAYLLAGGLIWALCGNLTAILFSSAGPCYYALLGLGDRFEPLMTALRQFNETSPVWSLNVQNLLWSGYTAESTMRGISAFPSMHVASTTLMMLYAFTWKRWAGWSMVVFLGLIMAGSVHLGWHYAVDGYASIALTLACWRVARLVTSSGRPAPAEAAPQPAGM